jgi:aryl-alcohol dehydrogenase-like predicted oxidoreductase
MKSKQDPPIPFRLTKENVKRLKEIEEMTLTVSNRNAAMNYIIKTYYQAVVVPRKSTLNQIKREISAFEITVSELF